MIAVDTNLLIHAHREDSVWHGAATAALAELTHGGASWAIPWPCIHEFLAIVTHPRIFNPPTPRASALKAVESWRESPTLSLLGETESHWSVLSDLLAKGEIVGAQVHDARIAAICIEHAVEALLTADRDFSRFPALRTRNPLVPA